MLCNSSPDNPVNMKLGQDTHLVTLSKIHERFSRWTYTRGLLFVQGAQDRVQGPDKKHLRPWRAISQMNRNLER